MFTFSVCVTQSDEYVMSLFQSRVFTRPCARNNKLETIMYQIKMTGEVMQSSSVRES